MLAFEVLVDGRRICLAGMDDWSVMSVILSAVRDRELNLSVGGLSQPDSGGTSHHARWEKVDLQVGSKVTVRLVDSDEADPPQRRYASDRPGLSKEEIEEMERTEWLRLKAKFESDTGATP